MSDTPISTPLTDAEVLRYRAAQWAPEELVMFEGSALVRAGFARTLEHKLTTAQAEIAELRAKCDKLAEWCMDLRGEWQWKKDEPRAGNKAEYDALCADIDWALALRKSNPGGAHE